MEQQTPQQAPGRFSPHRLNALSDGIFAIAMTLLALEVKIPDAIADASDFQAALPFFLSSFGVFVVAFLITGQYWQAQHRAMSYVHTVDAAAIRQALSALIGIAALPIATSLITNWGRFREAVIITAVALALTSLLSARFYAHVLRPPLSDVAPDVRAQFVVQSVISAGIFLLAIPVSFLLATPSYATLLWLLLAVTGRFTRWLLRHRRPAD